MDGYAKVEYGGPVEGRIPNGSLSWKVEADGSTVRIDCELIPEFWVAVHTDRIMGRKRQCQESIVMIVRTTADKPSVNVVRHVTERELSRMDIVLTEQSTMGKSADYPQLIQDWDVLLTGRSFNKVLWLMD